MRAIIFKIPTVGFLFSALLLLAAIAYAAEPATRSIVSAPPALNPEERLAREFSLERAARSLDFSALHWQTTRKCAACHTLPPYLMARPLLNAVLPEPPDVRRFFETIVEHRREGEPSLPKDAVSAVVIEVAFALAFHDRITTGLLHPRTRQELDRMWSLQRPDGGWQWPIRDTPPMKSDEHYGVTLAALAAGIAPGTDIVHASGGVYPRRRAGPAAGIDLAARWGVGTPEGYSRDPTVTKGLAGIRRFLKANPPTSLHQRAMLVWAGRYVEDLAPPAEKSQTVMQLKEAQRPDGGWSMASLVENPNEPARQSEERKKARAQLGHGREFLIYVGRDKVYKSSLTSDGYATGFVVYVLRHAGVGADDARLRRGIAWLKSHQRESGRWFTPSQAWHTQHRIANAGTAYAVMALHACGEIPAANATAD